MTDGLGSVRGEVGASLEMDASTHYAPYGTPFDAQSTSGFEEVPFGFTGEHTDPTGQVHLRARQYDPALGVFTSSDPFAGMHDMPMSLNGYSYVHGNPIMHTDPSGRIASSVAGAVGGAIFGGFSALALHRLAKSGRCGCRLKNEFSDIGLIPFVVQVAGFSALLGGILGAIATNPLLLARLSAILNGFGVGVSVADILQNGLNACNFLQLMSAGAGSILGGTGGGAPPVTYPQLNVFTNPGGTLAIGGAIGEVALPGAILVIPGILDTVGDLGRDLGDLLYSEGNGDEDSEGDEQERPEVSGWDKQRFIDRHLENTDSSNAMLKRGEAIHVFNDRETLERVANEILERGDYIGVIRNFERWGLMFDEVIGHRIDPDGSRIPLQYGELKIRPEARLYHVIPRTRPS